MDSSGSIALPEWRQQVTQTAEAIRSHEVVNAIERDGRLAVTAVAFADRPRTLVEWTLLETRADAESFAARLVASERPFGGGTRIGPAIEYGVRRLAEAPCEPDRQVIDLSTDGVAPESEMAEARTGAEALGIRINGILVKGDEGDSAVLRRAAITSDGFLLEANSWEDYPLLFRRKIILEIGAL